MSTQRKKIRQAIKALLLDNTPAGARVWTNRPNPLSQRPGQQSASSQLPAILIYTRSEDSEVFNESPRQYKRTVEVVVEIAAAMNDDIDDTLDDYAQTVENLILLDDRLGTDPDDAGEYVADGTELTRSSMTIVDGGEIPIGAAILSFDVMYYTFHPADAEPELDDFEIASINYNLSGDQDEADQAKDVIYPEQS
jgi:hypothetical protein